MFIVLSGFGLAYSCLKSDRGAPWKPWFYKWFRRILPVYWVVVLASLPLVLLFDIRPRPGIDAELFRKFLDLVLLTNVNVGRIRRFLSPSTTSALAVWEVHRVDRIGGVARGTSSTLCWIVGLNFCGFCDRLRVNCMASEPG